MTTLKLIVKATIIAGTLDLSAAFLLYYLQTGKAPWIILNFIASGLFGKAAFAGAAWMAVAGLLFHFAITFLFACFFFFVVARTKAAHYWPATALWFGVFAWCVMNLVVLPFSGTPKSAMTVSSAVTGILVLVTCIGLPFVLLLRQHHKIKKPVSYHRLI